MKRLNALFTALVVPWISILACNGETHVVENSGDGDSQGSSGEHAEQPDATDEGSNTCCPRDPSPSGCMNLGGSAKAGCSRTCDFFCSTNWRVEHDEAGCEVWRWDVRSPQAGETQQCFSDPDAGTLGCDPPCSADQVCAKYQVLGGIPFPGADADTCPEGSHWNGATCERDPSFACVARPATCGPGQLDCGCAESICATNDSCSFTCASTTSSQVNCNCQAP